MTEQHQQAVERVKALISQHIAKFKPSNQSPVIESLAFDIFMSSPRKYVNDIDSAIVEACQQYRLRNEYENFRPPNFDDAVKRLEAQGMVITQEIINLAIAKMKSNGAFMRSPSGALRYAYGVLTPSKPVFTAQPEQKQASEPQLMRLLGQKLFNRFCSETVKAWFDSPTYKPYKASSLAREWIPSQKNFLILCGRNGAGKTFAGVCSLIKYMGANTTKKAVFIAFDDVVDAVAEKDDAKKSLLLSCDILMLDDIQTDQQATLSDACKKFIAKLLKYRYDHKKPTILTSNSSSTALRTCFGSDVESRLNQNEVFYIGLTDEPDYRQLPV